MGGAVSYERGSPVEALRRVMDQPPRLLQSNFTKVLKPVEFQIRTRTSCFTNCVSEHVSVDLI